MIPPWKILLRLRDSYDGDDGRVVARRRKAPLPRDGQVDRHGRPEPGVLAAGDGCLPPRAGGGDGEGSRGGEVGSPRAVPGFDYLRHHGIPGGVELAGASKDFGKAVRGGDGCAGRGDFDLEEATVFRGCCPELLHLVTLHQDLDS